MSTRYIGRAKDKTQIFVNRENVTHVTDNQGDGKAPTTIHFVGGTTVVIADKGWRECLDELNRP